ncbi:MAG: cysteine--tRNA ligase [Oceanospirillaceae bacterium]|nr:cysteine--tRNA ligase [Oceanospirillaceae bacterium]
MLQIYNTLTKSKQPFTPINPGQIRMYVCGITVYDLCHIGHARVMVCFDLITRYLRARGWDVDYVRNITDVDDKILRRAAENGESVEELTARMIAAMHEDEAALSVLRPDQEPRATRHIGDILEMVQTLIDKGYAYAALNGDVYYRVDKFATYGKLTNKVVDELRAGARVEVESAKESPLDFVLWKAAKAGELSWESPWGAGRPGWHIECSAMSKCCLGDTFDIHGGGPDLPFPHHENEIAQSEAANGKTYVNYWMHAGPVRVNAEKMSKSLGNFFTIRDVLKEHNPEVVRYFLASVHYRSHIDYSTDSLREAKSALDRFYQALEGVKSSDSKLDEQSDYTVRFYEAMDDDFNTPRALAVLFDLVGELNRAKAEGLDTVAYYAGQLRALGGLIGLLQQESNAYLQHAAEGEITPEVIEALIQERKEARAAKEFARSDEIRDQLAAQGVVLKDGPQGTQWYREG